jgi:hypothetical protein
VLSGVSRGTMRGCFTLEPIIWKRSNHASLAKCSAKRCWNESSPSAEDTGQEG